MKIEEYI